MGIQFQVTLAHALDADTVARLARAVSGSPDAARAVEALHAALTLRWPRLEALAAFGSVRWTDSVPTPEGISARWSAGRAPHFDWAGFSVDIGRHAIVMTHIEKFGAFLDRDLGLQHALRDACRAFASCVGERRVMYSGDAYVPAARVLERVWAGATFETLCDELRAAAGPPAHDIAACERISNAGRDLSGWFIDDFADLA